MSSTNLKKVLRVGLIRNGKIVEEKVLKRDKTITIGESAKNTIMVPSCGLPSSLTLFSLQDGRYHLHFSEEMKGQVSADKQLLSLGNLVERSEYIGEQVAISEDSGQKESGYRYPLNNRCRGKLEFGECTLLFQMVNAPVTQKARKVSWRPSWKRRVDWVYASVLMISLVVHSGFVALCHSVGTLPEAPVTDFSKVTQFPSFPNFVPPVKPPVERPKETDTDKPEKPNAESKQEENIDKKPPRTQDGKGNTSKEKPAPTMTREQLRKLMDKQLFGDGTSSFKKLISANTTDAYKKSLSSVSPDMVFRGQEVNRSKSRSGEKGKELVKVGGDLKIPGENKCSKPPCGTDILVPKSPGRKGPTKIKKVKFDIEKDGIPTPPSDPNEWRRFFNKKRRALQYCYEREIKRNPSLRGRIAVNITIAKNRRASQVEVEENQLNKTVENCIVRKIKRWRFPKVKGDSVEVNLPIIYDSTN